MNVLACTLACGSLAFCGVASLAPTTACADQPSLRAEDTAASIDGTIRSVDMEGRSFVIESDGKTISIRVDDNTRYMLDGKTSTMTEVVKTSAKVKVSHKDHLAVLVQGNIEHVPPPKRES